ncbi:hypothetical protein Y1Q_0005350 [Alligator mississippiensis]|uniref:Uncharacterized protein n=1 Tax=Alligator mississippiensis TaxID=8496 RepID=A0A151MVH1_ALLMI|nr:hypothetical protein Y1Q_0005350 [Alligator mississippiensis]
MPFAYFGKQDKKQNLELKSPSHHYAEHTAHNLMYLSKLDQLKVCSAGWKTDMEGLYILLLDLLNSADRLD